MKVVCYMSRSRRDDAIGSALERGFKRHGMQVEVLRDGDFKPGAGLAVTVGTRASSARIYEAAQAAGQHTLMMDKGYFGRGRYHRMSLNSPQPLYVSKMGYDSKRFKSIWQPPVIGPRPPKPTNIIVVEATQKYYDFHELGLMQLHTKHVCNALLDVVHAHPGCGLRVVYRPRLKAHEPIPPAPEGTELSVNLSMAHILGNAHCLVTHGSTAGIEALLAGVPVVTVGGSSVNPVADLSVAGISDALLTAIAPPYAVALARAAQLAWCQFTLTEIGSGFSWEHLKPWLNHKPAA